MVRNILPWLGHLFRVRYGLFSSLSPPSPPTPLPSLHFPPLPPSLLPGGRGACVGVIVSATVGIWQRPRFGEPPHAEPHSATGALWGWEVSLSRTTQCPTKAITSPSAFLKGPGSDAGARGPGNPSKTGQCRDHTKPNAPREAGNVFFRRGLSVERIDDVWGGQSFGVF